MCRFRRVGDTRVHGLPNTTAFARLLGLKVNQVCIGEFQLQIHFEGEMSLAIESKIAFKSGGRKKRQTSGRGRLNLVNCGSLAGSSVAEVLREADAIVIGFTDGAKLWLVDDSIKYESFELKFPGGSVIV